MELEIHQLNKKYSNDVQALKDVSLTIPPGMFGLLGPNGAGKSTLMRTIATLQEVDTGTISLGDINVLKQKDAVRKLLGYLPQEFGLYPKVTAIDLLNHFAILKGISRTSERKEIVHALLQKTNLYEARNRKLGGFSGGMKQRFGIAQALLGDPKLIIVDEPTAGLDPEERVRFHNLLSEIGEHIIVILSTHIVSDVSQLCQKMAILHQGEVVLTGEPLTVVKNLEGKIWKKLIAKTEISSYQESHFVISTKLSAGKTLLRVHSEEQPDPSFEPAIPELEDVYFFAIRERERASDIRLAS